VIEVRLRSKTSQEELEAKVGKILTEEDYNLRLTGPAKVLKPDGKPLCVYLPGAMKGVSTGEVYDILHSLRSHTSKNRGLASGSPRIYDGAGKRAYALEVSSSIVGAIDPGGVYKYCRLTVWTGENLPKWRQLERVAVGLGPGRFTGLRVGVATARGLAQSLSIELAGVSSLHALAAGALRTGSSRHERVLAVIDALRGEVFAAAYALSAGQVLPMGTFAGALEPEELAARIARARQLGYKT